MALNKSGRNLIASSAFVFSVREELMTLQSLPAKHVYQMRQPHQSCRAYIENARRHF